jgi:hypothetical protein
MKGLLSYIRVNMGCANCMMSHISAVNSNINSYRNLPDNLNYMADSCHHIDQFICSNCMICCIAAISWRLDSWCDAPDNLVCSKSDVFIFNPSMMFLNGDMLQYGLLYTLSIVSRVFIGSILETGCISVIRCKDGKFPFSPT